MTNDIWTIAGHAVTVTGVAGLVSTGAKCIYDAHGPTYSSLVESGRTLEKVRLRLQRCSPQRRELLEIEIASQTETSHGDAPRSLGDLEKELEDLSDVHCRLSKRYEEATFGERYFPYTQFRSRVLGLESKIKSLLNDTWKTTVPYVDDIDFGISETTWQVVHQQASSGAGLGRPHAFGIEMTPRPGSRA